MLVDLVEVVSQGYQPAGAVALLSWIIVTSAFVSFQEPNRSGSDAKR
jgi:hypothetical protein